LKPFREHENLKGFFIYVTSKESVFARTWKVCEMVKVREMDIELYRNYANLLEAGSEPRWRYDETKPCGANFKSALCAWCYDGFHQKFRDYEAESRKIIGSLGVGSNGTLIDMGCGTGAFTIYAVSYYSKVYAVDVFKAMLNRARKKARKAGLDNVEFHLGGFLTYEHKAQPVDALVSTFALHHLPDFWKMVGLMRLAQMLKTEGRLYIRDIVFSFEQVDYESCIEKFIESMTQRTGPQTRQALETHISREYSTYGWIMEGLLDKAGFEIETANYKDGFFAEYVCTKRTE